MANIGGVDKHLFFLHFYINQFFLFTFFFNTFFPDVTILAFHESFQNMIRRDYSHVWSCNKWSRPIIQSNGHGWSIVRPDHVLSIIVASHPVFQNFLFLAHSKLSNFFSWRMVINARRANFRIWRNLKSLKADKVHV